MYILYNKLSHWHGYIFLIYFLFFSKKKKIMSSSRTDTKLCKDKHITLCMYQYLWCFILTASAVFASWTASTSSFIGFPSTIVSVSPGKWHSQSHSNVNEITCDNVKQQMLRYPIWSGITWFSEKLHLNQNIWLDI